MMKTRTTAISELWHAVQSYIDNSDGHYPISREAFQRAVNTATVGEMVSASAAATMGLWHHNDLLLEMDSAQLEVDMVALGFASRKRGEL